MKQVEDKQTGDLLNGFIRQPGRPPTGKALTAAQRQKARRDRLKAAGMVTLTVEVSSECLEAMRDFLRFKDETQDQLIERLLRTQLMRKR